MKLSIVVAMALNRVIGNKGVIPWAGKLPADMERFIKITKGGWVIMGRKTWESIPSKFRPLDGRKNVVLTRQSDHVWLGGFCEATGGAGEVLHRYREAVPYVMVAHDLLGVLAAIEMVDSDANVFIVGGAEVYTQALPLAEKIFCTIVQSEFVGDTVFPEIDPVEWEMIDDEPHAAAGKNKFDYRFRVYVRADSISEPVVDPNNARNQQYREQLLRIQAGGKCPFCPEGETFTDPESLGQFVCEMSCLHIKLNQYPISGAKLHCVIIFKRHMKLASELSETELCELAMAMRWIRETYGTDGGVLYMREGATSRTGATVVHLHAQYIVPDDGQVVQIFFGGNHPEAAR